MAFVDVGVGFVRSLVVWLEANRAPAPTALWSLYLRLKAAPKSVTPIAITISKGNETANSRISDPSVPAHASTHLSHAFLSESVMPFTLLPGLRRCFRQFSIHNYRISRTGTGDMPAPEIGAPGMLGSQPATFNTTADISAGKTGGVAEGIGPTPRI